MIETVSIVEGKGSVKVIEKKSNQMKLTTDLQEQSLVQFHTIDFPGWQLYIDGQKQPVIKNYPNLEGIIIANVNSGRHNIDLIFSETPLRKVANYISLASFITLLLLLIVKRFSIRVF